MLAGGTGAEAALGILDPAVAIARTRAADVGPQFAQARKQGLSDAELVEVVAAVAQNVLTNYLNVVAGTEVDFPASAESAARQSRR